MALFRKADNIREEMDRYKQKFENHRLGIGRESGSVTINLSSGKNFFIRQPIVGRNTRADRKNPFASLVHQKYDEIRAKCQADGILFEDPEFEAVDTSISFSGAPFRRYEWKRPSVSFFFLHILSNEKYEK